MPPANANNANNNANINVASNRNARTVAAPFSNPHATDTKTEIEVGPADVEAATSKRTAFWAKRQREAMASVKDLDAQILAVLIDQGRKRVETFYALEEAQEWERNHGSKAH